MYQNLDPSHKRQEIDYERMLPSWPNKDEGQSTEGKLNKTEEEESQSTHMKKPTKKARAPTEII